MKIDISDNFGVARLLNVSTSLGTSFFEEWLLYMLYIQKLSLCNNRKAVAIGRAYWSQFINFFVNQRHKE